MEKILISGCLAGALVRYDAKRVPIRDKWLKKLLGKGLLHECCPEVDGGMPIPRPPAQIVGGTGIDVLAGRARVMDVTGCDVTDFFLRGAEYALSVVKKQKIKVALMKEKSPSCGSGFIYDGSFTGQLIDGDGVTSALLRQNGVRMFSESKIVEFKLFVKQNFSEFF